VVSSGMGPFTRAAHLDRRAERARCALRLLVRLLVRLPAPLCALALALVAVAVAVAADVQRLQRAQQRHRTRAARWQRAARHQRRQMLLLVVAWPFEAREGVRGHLRDKGRFYVLSASRCD
jgi:hypothetical protein